MLAWTRSGSSASLWRVEGFLFKGTWEGAWEEKNGGEGRKVRRRRREVGGLRVRERGGRGLREGA